MAKLKAQEKSKLLSILWRVALLIIAFALIAIAPGVRRVILVYERQKTYLAELEPPARYNHPYNGPVIERIMPLAELYKICGDDGVACAWVTGGTCYVVLPSDLQAYLPVYRRHETAHCNGWAQNHAHDG